MLNKTEAIKMNKRENLRFRKYINKLIKNDFLDIQEVNDYTAVH